MKISHQKTDFSKMWGFRLMGRDFIFGYINMDAAAKDAEQFGEENVNDRLNRNEPIKYEPHVVGNKPFGIDLDGDPFAAGTISPKEVRAALDHINLEYGPVCTTTCGTYKCRRVRGKLHREITTK